MVRGGPFLRELHGISYLGLGAILGQEGRPVMCVSRRLTKAGQGYSETPLEALVINGATNRLQKCLHNVPFKIAIDHKALEFIYNPDKPLARNLTAMVQRWAVDLSSHCYTIEHRSAKQIPHANFLSRYSRIEPPEHESSTLLIQLLPVHRDDLVTFTKQYFSNVIKALKTGLLSKHKRQFQEFYKHCEEFFVRSDGILSLNDRLVVPPNLRNSILQDFHCWACTR